MTRAPGLSALVLLGAMLAALLAGSAQAACRQALALGLDVSGSVDAAEYRLQLDGLAGALMHPEVLDAILQMPAAPVRIAVYEWSEEGRIGHLVGWTELGSAADVAAVAEGLRATARIPRPPGTALGGAILAGRDLLASQGGCWSRTLDISGDGKSNVGPHPGNVSRGLPDWLVINALVIGLDIRGNQDARDGIAELVSYFRAYVLHGPGAFVETALGFADYEAAMVRKLKRELQGIVIGRLR